ncbi:hypothetical protein ACWJPI_28140, partial [Klebsiella pneumoniae]
MTEHKAERAPWGDFPAVVRNGDLKDLSKEPEYEAAKHGDHKAMSGTVAKLAMRQPFVLFKGLTFQKLCLPGAFRPGDHHN